MLGDTKLIQLLLKNDPDAVDYLGVLMMTKLMLVEVSGDMFTTL